MDSPDVVYRRTDRSSWLSFSTLLMVGLSCLLAAVGAWLQIVFVLPWAILIPCFWNPLSVWVTAENLEARLGAGILKKTIPLAEIKSIKPIDVPLSKRKRHIWLCFNGRALEIISQDGEVLWLGSSEPETLASFLEK
jgi:hypothetical protein